jgi:hypothetical protein
VALVQGPPTVPGGGPCTHWPVPVSQREPAAQSVFWVQRGMHDLAPARSTQM